ncbi:MAG: inorganic diphosphatase [Holosporales bacterium]|jgi:inorganic pyrophosphatase|nr:inorganic diphosphatase [Holosporales bacterium]
MINKNAKHDEFFQSLELLIKENGITIDRPIGFAHPRFPDLIYPINYGFINGTKSQDGEGIDVFQGDDERAGVVGTICTIDRMKRDSEVKILYNCTEENIETAMMMMNNGPMCGILVRR